MPLETRLKEQIKSTGPVTLHDFITQVLYDPNDGYYATKVPIGRTGDYITAPEIIQVFGEVIALWLVDVWQKAGSPTPFHLIEIGPGRGTMMVDILRTLKSLKVPLHELTIHLIEVSPLLKDIQKTTLSFYSASLYWHEDLSTLPQNQGYCLMIANEFWDALPIQQHVKVNESWVERLVGLEDDAFIFLPNEPTVKETSPAMPGLVDQISQHLKIKGGAALFIDYGYDQPDAIGDTLQALQNHEKQSPLIHIGQADLTHHVDFHRLSTLFQEAGLNVHGPVSQGDFLKSNGFELRTEQLCEQATPDQQGSLQTAAVRLTHPFQMGDLFKVIAVTNPATLQPSGFKP
jgi:NADH dehydrogenase [ubiquinone] 1 alpha subcomplex assembly factor 7